MSAPEPVNAETARFPEYIRPGVRPMMPFHEDVVASARAEGKVVEEVEDKSLGCAVIALGESGAPVVAMISGKHSNSAEPPFWAFPKGHPDFGESDVEGAAREVLEEIGIDVSASIQSAVFFEENYSYAGRLNKDA